jgi:hypothetical protein
MGKKIFISYKYSDELVQALPRVNFWEKTTARDYVDEIQDKLDESDHINKGERDDEDMSNLADTTIASKIGDKIFDSTVTIVLISKGMKENGVPEKEQCIPLEVSYSLREQSRQGQRSKTNAMLAVVLPDENGLYEYFITENSQCNSRTLHTDFLFQILKDNMFNHKNPKTRECNGHTIYSGYSSYIHSVKWEKFINDIDTYVETALEIWRNRNNYEIIKKIK